MKPKTFEELFAGTGIEPTKDENGGVHYNFNATLKTNNMKEKIKNILIDYGYGDDVDTVEIDKTDLDVIAEKIEDLFKSYYNQN